MSQDPDLKYRSMKRKASQHSSIKKTTAHLKLVISNPAVIQETHALFKRKPSTTGFTAEMFQLGDQLYEMKIRDHFHDLGCDLILEIEKSMGKTAVVCDFPPTLDESNKYLNEDEDLYGLIALQFQMKILKELFLFCTQHDASQLAIYMDDNQAEGFGIYQDFLAYSEETLTGNGEKAKMVIPTDYKVFDKWNSFMAETNLKFEQNLWRNQRLNSAIRRYLKARSRN